MKKDNGYKALLNTILTSGMAVILSYLINFFLTPFITNTVGTEAYGYVTLAKTMANYASIITVGFTAFMVRYITLSYYKQQYKESSAYFSSSVGAVSVLSLLILAIAGIGIIFMNKWLVVSEEMLSAVKILFILVFINFCITTFIVPYTSSCYIKNKLSIYNTFKTASYCVEAVVLFFLFKNFSIKIWYVGIGLIAASLTILIGCIIVTKKLTPEIKFERHLISLGKIRDLISNGIWQSVNSLGTVLNSGLDLLITNQMLSGLAMGQLSIAKTIGSMFSVLYSTISQAFQPRMMKAYAANDMKKLIKELKFAMRVNGFFSGCAFAGFVALGTLYYELWIPNQDYNFIFYLTVVTILGSVAEGVIYPAYFINTLTTKKMIPCFVTIISGLLNVAGMYLLIKYTDLGVYAVVWTTAILSFLTNFVFNPIYCALTLKLHWSILYPTIIRHVIGCIGMLVIFKMVTFVLNPSGWLMLVVSAIVCFGVGAFIYCVAVTNLREKKAILKKVRMKVS